LDTIDKAFEEAMLAHRDEIYRYAWRMVGDRQDAQDLTQETFLRAYRAFERLEPDSNVRAWLYRIATNACLTFLKRRGRERSVSLDAAWPSEALSHTETPLDRVGRLELLREVAQAVEGLPPRQRAAIVQRKYQGLSYAEIAASLGCSEQTARAHVYQGMRKLRAQFREEREVRHG
jgi:RNA polymerase sigma-70 factor (ECF subfamily)